MMAIASTILATVTLSLSCPSNYLYTIPMFTNRIRGIGMGETATHDYRTARAEDYMFIMEAIDERLKSMNLELNANIYPWKQYVNAFSWLEWSSSNVENLFPISYEYRVPKEPGIEFCSYAKINGTPRFQYIPAKRTDESFSIDGLNGLKYVTKYCDLAFSTNDFPSLAVDYSQLANPGPITNLYHLINMCKYMLFSSGFGGDWYNGSWLKTSVLKDGDIAETYPIIVKKRISRTRIESTDHKTESYKYSDYYHSDEPIQADCLVSAKLTNRTDYVYNSTSVQPHKFRLTLIKTRSKTHLMGMKVTDLKDGVYTCRCIPVLSYENEETSVEPTEPLTMTDPLYAFIPINKADEERGLVPSSLPACLGIFARSDESKTLMYNGTIKSESTNNYSVSYLPITLKRLSKSDFTSLGYGRTLYEVNGYSPQLAMRAVGLLGSENSLSPLPFEFEPPNSVVRSSAPAASSTFTEISTHTIDISVNLEIYLCFERSFNARILTE